MHLAIHLHFPSPFAGGTLDAAGRDEGRQDLGAGNGAWIDKSGYLEAGIKVEARFQAVLVYQDIPRKSQVCVI